MARLWHSGIENRSVATAVEFTAVIGTPAIDTTIKRTGAASLRCNTAAGAKGINQVFRLSGSELALASVHIYIATLPDADTDIVAIGSAGGSQGGKIILKTDGTLQLSSNAANVGSPSAALNTGQWYTVELSYDDSDGNNTIVGKLSGTQFATGIGTDLGGTALRLRVGVLSNVTADIYFDDIVINDNTGSYENTFPGPQRVKHSKANAAGDNSQWDGDDGTTDPSTPNTYLDEEVPDDATSYLRSRTTGDITDVNVEACGLTSETITTVAVGFRGNRSAGSVSSTARARLKASSGGTVENGPTESYSTTTWRTNTPSGNSCAPFPIMTYTKPGTANAWTPSDIDSAQVGIECVSGSGDRYAQMSKVWLSYTYLDASGTDANVNVSVITATATTPTTVPEVKMLPGTLSINANVLSPSHIIDSNFNAPVLAISANLQNPVHRILMQPSVLTTSAVIQALQEKLIVKSPSIISINATIQTPILQIIKQLSQLSLTASLIAPSVTIGTDWSVFAPVITATAIVNNPTKQISKDISVILGNAAVLTPTKLVSKDIAALIANAQLLLPQALAEKNIIINAPVLTAIAILTPTGIIVTGPSIPDTIVYTDTITNPSMPQKNVTSPTVYDEIIPTPSSTPKSIADEIFYDEETP